MNGRHITAVARRLVHILGNVMTSKFKVLNIIAGCISVLKESPAIFYVMHKQYIRRHHIVAFMMMKP